MCFDTVKDCWLLQGTLSYHGNCGRRQQPPIYSGLSREINSWIVQTVGNDKMFRN